MNETYLTKKVRKKECNIVKNNQIEAHVHRMKVKNKIKDKRK
jgi:hypothetical protein